ncbi:hypothetical protein EAO79_18605 [Plantibacter sp. PA-3-X8]|uniref:hypothetical protein n=1 Tax=Plantibacter sp. PA-3-X8 TaxID=2480625 RepID=UPI000F5EB98E|nr:hypothetical protein [Plantibacter sp. PA-3-X8]AZH84686.1 hypothetical protein EAO79_18605 [Plantibacter sp. PA-3-X8]
MIRSRWRALLATPALLALVVGGSVLTAPAANAASLLTVTAPADGSTVASRTVEVTGLAPADATVVVLNAAQTEELGRGAVTAEAEAAQGTFDITLTPYDDNDTVAQSIFVTVEDGSEAAVPVNFNLPITPADAFDVVSPTQGQVFDTSDITFSGTGTDGAIVTVNDSLGRPVAGTNNVTVVDGTWTAALDFAIFAGEREFIVYETLNDQLVQTIYRTITLPPTKFVVKTPTNGQVLTSSNVTFSGNGTNGATVTVNDSLGRPVVGKNNVTVINGEWSAEVSLAAYSGERTFYVYQQLGSEQLGSTELKLTVPDSQPVFYDAPIVTSPTNGQQVPVTDMLIIRGTAQPGTDVYLVAVPKELYEASVTRTAQTDLVEPEATAEARVADAGIAAAAAVPAPVYPLAPVRVDNNGDWEVLMDLDAGTWVVLSVIVDSTAAEFSALSPISDPVEFTVTAAATTVDSGTTSNGPSNGTSRLAETGVESPSLIGAAGLLAAAGILLMLVRTRSVRTARAAASTAAPRA